MFLRAKFLQLEADKPIVILNREDAEEMGVKPLERVELDFKDKKIIAIVNIAGRIVREGDIGLYEEIQESLDVKPNEKIRVETTNPPKSLDFIKKKLAGQTLKPGEIHTIVKDTVNRRLSHIELTAFVTSLYNKGMTMNETASLSKAMAKTGQTLKLRTKAIYDKHSVTWDTLVIIENKGVREIVKIGEFIDKLIDKHDCENIENGEYLPINEKINVLSFDKNFNVSFKPLTGVYRHPSPKYVHEITLKGNRKCVVTHCHSVFILRNGKVMSIPTKNLKKDDFVVVPREIPEVNSSPKTINVLEELLKLPENLTKEIYITKISHLYRRVIPKERRNYDLISLNDYRKHKVKLSKNSKLRVKHGNDIPIKLKISPDLIRILGYWIAEGYNNENGVHFSFGIHEKKLISDVKSDIKKAFGLNATVTHPHKTAVHINIYNQLMSKVFDYIFDLKHRARNKEVPKIIFNLPKDLQLEFLRAYFKGDGYFRRNYEAISNTASKELSVGLCYLLSLCGISYSLSFKKAENREFPSGYISETSPVHYIYTQANPLLGRESRSSSYLNFIPIKEANFSKFGMSDYWDWQSRREFRRKKFVTFDRIRSLMDTIPNGGEAEAKKLAYGNLGFIQIKSIKRIKSECKYVYDFCVEGYENFVGGSSPMFLHNSIGGCPGDKTSILVVPVVASAGLTIPKTSSRAITSPAGSADRFECIAPVDLTLEEVRRVVNKTNGCLVWGGSVDLAPADDIFIQIEYLLSIDPFLLPSVMSKKKAVNAKYVVIDMPTGRETKVRTNEEFENLANQFIQLGKKLGIKVNCVSTFAEQPIGYSVGPILEAREALDTLVKGRGSEDLIDKVTTLAGVLLEFGGAKNGKKAAIELLNSGKAYKKLKEIIEAQGGNPDVKPEDLCPGEKIAEFKSKKSGKVLWISNKCVDMVAREAGAPRDKGAGVYFRKKLGDKVRRGETLFEIYSEKSSKFERAIELVHKIDIMGIGKERGMMLEKLPAVEEEKRYFILER